MSRTIATSQSREPPSTHAVPDRPPPTSGGPSRIFADGVTSPSPRHGFATAGRDTLGSARAGEGPSCSVGERRWNDRESDLQVHCGRITNQGNRLVRWAAIEPVQRRRDFLAIASESCSKLTGPTLIRTSSGADRRVIGHREGGP